MVQKSASVKNRTRSVHNGSRTGPDHFHVSGIGVAVFLLLLSIPSYAKTQAHSLWEELGLYGGQIHAVAVDPFATDTVYAGSWMGDGLFKSTNAGTTWTSIEWFRNVPVFDIAVDPDDPATIWVANSTCVDVSHDAGITWKTFYFAAAQARFCYALAIDSSPEAYSTVYVGTGGPHITDTGGTIFYTTDSGRHWIQEDFKAAYNVHDIKINTQTPGELWCASTTYDVSNNGMVYVRPGPDEQWYCLPARPNCYTNEVAIHPEAPLTVFACNQYGVLRKSNGPETGGWHWALQCGGCVCESLCLPACNPDILYAGFPYHVAKSTDTGSTWQHVSAVESQFICMKADPANHDIVYGGSLNRGLFKTEDGGFTWNMNNAGIKANTVYAVDTSSRSASSILCGTLAGVYVSSDSKTWRLIHDSPSEALSFHPDDSRVLYAGFTWEIGKSSDGGRSWHYRTMDGNKEIHGISAMAVRGDKPCRTTVLAAVQYYTDNRGEIIEITDNDTDFSTASYRSVFQCAVPVNAVAFSPDDAAIFAGTGSFYSPVAPGGLYVSTDQGVSWSAASLEQSVVNSISISPAAPSTVYAACGGSDGTHAGIYVSTDGGSSWEEKTGGLPDSCTATEIHADSKHKNVVYAAVYDVGKDTSGVYVSLDNGGYWSMLGLSDHFLYTLGSCTPEPHQRPAGGDSSREPVVNECTIPAGTVLAGTSCGLYSASTAGFGIIRGLVTSEETRNPVHGALITTQLGAACKSSDGYFFLLVPSGTHTIKIHAADFYSKTIAGIRVTAGEASKTAIALRPLYEGEHTSTDNATDGCAAAALLADTGYGNHVPLLRRFRDTVLKNSTFGRQLIMLYYARGMEMVDSIQKNPLLKASCIKLLETAIPFLCRATTRKNTHIPCSLLQETCTFISDLEGCCSQQLRQQLQRLRRDVKRQQSILPQ